MELDPKYTFVPLMRKSYVGINDKATQDFLCKWGLKDNIVIQDFSFNEPFQVYHKYCLVEALFKNDTVAKVLLSKHENSWIQQGFTATTVEIKHIPCSILNMSFFDKLRCPENKIVYNTGTIRKRYDTEIDGFLVSDNLRGMLLDEESPEYELYTTNEKNEFIFRIFQLLVLGGTLCQYEDTLEPYLNMTKTFYKDLIRVQKQSNSENLAVNTMVFEVVAKNHNQAYFPSDLWNRQNVAFVLIHD